jgi:hypothetical protein
MRILRRTKTRQRFNKTPNNLVGPQMKLFVPWYQDYGMTRMEAVKVVRCMKRLEASKLDEIIQEGLDQLTDISLLSGYDLIIALPSSYGLVSRIMSELFIQYDNIGGKLIEGLMYKLPSSEMKIDWEKAHREGSEKTIPRLESFYQKVKSGAFQIKEHAGSNRRYLYNFLTFNQNHIAFELLKKARRILLVDDTYGIGASLTEALRIIREINPTVEARGFCLIHDFPCRTKMCSQTLAGGISF